MSDKSITVLVVGLGRFGASVARSLERMGHEVLGVDLNPACVEHLAQDLTQVVEADATDIEVLKRLGAADFDAAVVGIGSNIESSVLTTLALADLKIPKICCKAENDNHGRILSRTGATSVVFPEARMGERVAHVLNGAMIDYIEFDDNFSIAKLAAPKSISGMTLDQSSLRTKYGVTVIGLKRYQEDFVHANPELCICEGDLLIVSGPTEVVERFAAVR